MGNVVSHKLDAKRGPVGFKVYQESHGGNYLLRARYVVARCKKSYRFVNRIAKYIGRVFASRETSAGSVARI